MGLPVQLQQASRDLTIGNVGSYSNYVHTSYLQKTQQAVANFTLFVTLRGHKSYQTDIAGN